MGVSAVIPSSGVELLTARRLGVSVVYRSDVLAELMGGRVGIAVVGTQGKSSTSAMLVRMLIGEGLEPSYAVGAGLVGGPGGHVSGGGLFVAKGDESNRGFVRCAPSVAVVLNMDLDQPEAFADLPDVYAAYGRFGRRVVPGGVLVVRADDPRGPHGRGRVVGRRRPQ